MGHRTRFIMIEYSRRPLTFFFSSQDNKMAVPDSSAANPYVIDEKKKKYPSW
jgi:hypothetical protein